MKTTAKVLPCNEVNFDKKYRTIQYVYLDGQLEGLTDMPIVSEEVSDDSLINNLRKQLELLNNYTFSDNEWERFFNDCISNNNDGIVEKTRKIVEGELAEEHHMDKKRDCPAGRYHV